MPRIRTYESQVQSAGPANVQRANPDDFGAGIGRATAGLGEAVGDIADVIAKRNEQSEISDLKVKFASAQADFTNVIKEQIRTADPSDKNFVENFMQTYRGHIEALGDGVSTGAGRRAFQEMSAQYDGHFLNYAMEGQAQLAGEKSKQDYTGAVTQWSSALRNDPSSLDFVRAQHDQYIQDLVKNHGLSQEQALKLKIPGDEGLTKNAIRGWIDLNPQLAQKQLNSGKWDQHINGDVKNQMLGEADQAIRAQDVEKERQRREQERVLKEKQQVTQNNFLAKMVAGQLTDKDILNSNLEPTDGAGSKRAFIDMLKTHLEGGIKDDPGTVRALWDRIHLPDNDPKKIRDEDELNLYMGRGLKLETLQTLRGEINGARSEEGKIEAELKKGVIDVAKSALTKSNPLTGIKDPSGDEQLQRYMDYFLNTYSAQRKAGKTATELLSPDSPSYLGKSIRSYVRSPQQIIKDLSRFNGSDEPQPDPTLSRRGPSPTPSSTPSNAPSNPEKPVRLKDEKPEDFLKRTKK